jgi:hypothetical protein
MASLNIKSTLSPFYFKNVPAPLANIDPKLVNVTNSNDPRTFGSTETNREWSITPSVFSNNANAAAASALKGGSSNYKKRIHTLRKKIKNIVNKYKKMKGRKMTLGSLRRRFGKSKGRNGHKKSKKNNSRKHRRGTRRQRGGYSQYMSNVPYTPSYSTGGDLSPSLSALANPVPHQLTNNCQDNYNHFLQK